MFFKNQPEFLKKKKSENNIAKNDEHLRRNIHRKIFSNYKKLKKPNGEYIDRESYILDSVQMHNNLNTTLTLESNEDRVNFLLHLEPFFSTFNHCMENKGEEIIREISIDYKSELYRKKDIVFRYGDEADRIFIVHEGEVELFFPFLETINMTIDEFYIYILRLRRFNEMEMLNTVLLLNNGEFFKEFDESFDIDEYFYKLYCTYLKLKFDPTFRNQNKEVIKRKPKKTSPFNNADNSLNNIRVNSNTNIIRINSPNNHTNKINNNDSNSKKKSYQKYYEEMHEYLNANRNFDDNLFKTFSDKELKELILRIGDELIETMKWVMPEKLYDIVEEQREEFFIKKIVKIPQILIKKYQLHNPNRVNPKEYVSRILPVKRPNPPSLKLPAKKILVMKYLYLGKVKRGECFGNFSYDTLSLFSSKYLNLAKESRIHYRLHNFNHFRNMTAICALNTENLYMGSFNEKIFNSYFSKYFDRLNFKKKNYLINNSLFLNSETKNLIRTYSQCFHHKKILEREFIFQENDKLKENNIYVYFIINGEFQVTCNKTIYEVDKAIRILGDASKIPGTFPKILKDLENTPYVDELMKKRVSFKLNYLSKNDLVGLSEILDEDIYFNNIECVSEEANVYYVDIRIINVLINSDDNIKNNKNMILKKKYSILSDILLKQRKIFFDVYFNKQAVLGEEKENTNQKNDDSTEDNKNTNNLNSFIANLGKGNLNQSPKFQKIENNFENQSKINEVVTKKYTKKLDRESSITKLKESDDKNKIITNLGNLDILLANSSGRFTLKDRREKLSLMFRKNYEAKLEKLKKNKINKKMNMSSSSGQSNEKENRSKNIEFFNLRNQKLLDIVGIKNNKLFFTKLHQVLPLLPAQNKKLNSNYELIIPYEKCNISLMKKSNSAKEINPLTYDNFNRSYNTGSYFSIFKKNLKFNRPTGVPGKYYSPNEEIFFNKDKNNVSDLNTIEYNLNIKGKEIKKFIKIKENKKEDLVTKKLKRIYYGKFDKILNVKENSKNKRFCSFK